MGVVYEAFDRERNARVALKTLKTSDATAVLRFKNEFRWLQDLQHPNLVSFHELFSESGQWFFTMELVDGVDFLTWVRAGRSLDLAAAPDATTDPVLTIQPTVTRGSPYDEARLRGALTGLARGIAALHAAQKVHRDI